MSGGKLFSLPASWRDDMHGPIALRTGGAPLTRQRFIGDLDNNIGLLRQLPHESAILYTTSLYWFAVGLLALAACRKRVIIAANDLPASLARLRDHAGLIVSDRERAFPGAQHQTGPGRDVPDAAWPDMDMASPLSFFTSGSTGVPKRIDKRLGHLIAEAGMISELFAAQRGDIRSVCGTVPHHHAYGLAFRLIWPLLSGIPFRDETPEFLENALAEVDAGTLFVTSPAHLHRLDGFAPLPATRRPACVLSAGAPLDEGAARQAEGLFGCPVTEIYGSTETGALASRRHDRSGQPWRTLPSVQLVYESSGHATAKAPHLPGGEAELADEIRMRGGGGFDLLGRRDRIAKIEGARVSLDEVEAHLHALDDVAEAFVILRGRPARLAACVVPSAVGAEFLANQGAFRFNRRIRAALAIHLEAASLPRHWCFVEQLPRGAMGKISQRDVETLFDD